MSKTEQQVHDIILDVALQVAKGTLEEFEKVDLAAEGLAQDIKMEVGMNNPHIQQLLGLIAQARTQAIDECIAAIGENELVPGGGKKLADVADATGRNDLRAELREALRALKGE